MRGIYTDLHTHLIGMLEARDFLRLIADGCQQIYFPLETLKHDRDSFIPSIDIVKNKFYRKKSEDVLRIKHGDQINYNQMNDYYNVRSEILKYLVEVYGGLDPKNSVYNAYFNLVLNELVNQGVCYTEISYSIPNLISKLKPLDQFEGVIDYRFLLSTDRHNDVEKVKENAKKVPKMTDKKVIGFDLMGTEEPFTKQELDCSKNNPRSFKRKLEIIIENLCKKEGLVLRIHSGETPECIKNTEQTLIYIDEIINELKQQKQAAGEMFYMPEIRIGHGLYFEKSQQYIKLLKKLGVTIEINASSNFALSNIESFVEIPYTYYTVRGIPITICSDGHGIYDTTLENENKIYHDIMDVQMAQFNQKQKVKGKR